MFYTYFNSLYFISKNKGRFLERVVQETFPNQRAKLKKEFPTAKHNRKKNFSEPRRAGGPTRKRATSQQGNKRLYPADLPAKRTLDLRFMAQVPPNAPAS